MTAAQVRDRLGERRLARDLDALANRSAVRLHTHSPNDVLVQIALPLILILAITARLTMVAHSMAAGQRAAPVVMELWKQQIIMRAEQVLDGWERDAGFGRFPDLERVTWRDGWPADPALADWFAAVSALNDPAGFEAHLTDTIVREHQDAMAATERRYGGLELPPDMEARGRAYAAELVGQRRRAWDETVRRLQWDLLARVSATLPLTEATSDADLTRQFHLLAEALDARGYPLLAAVRGEYRTPPVTRPGGGSTPDDARPVGEGD